MIFSSIFTRNENTGEIELQQGTLGADYTARVPSAYVIHLWGIK
jgi:hypothetical protein